ncbi:MAG: sigma-70 family RNA polymerase sigma factor [Mobilitalea sp.]
METNSINTVEIIMKKYGDMVYQLALSQTKSKANAEDIYQEVFLKLIVKKPHYENEEHLKALLIRMTVNKCKDLWKSAWFRNTIPYEIIEDTRSYPAKEESKSDIYECVISLPEKYRVIIHLFYYEEMSIEEIGNSLKMKYGTVASKLSRGRKLLKERMEGDYYGRVETGVHSWSEEKQNT